MSVLLDDYDGPSIKQINIFQTKICMSERNNKVKKLNESDNIIFNDNEVYLVDDIFINKEIDSDNEHTLIISNLPITEISILQNEEIITNKIDESILFKEFKEDVLFIHCRSCMIFLTYEQGKI